MGWMDYHLHTRDSSDSTETMDAICRRAVALGLEEICFTEHYDVDPYDPGYNYYDDDRYEDRLAAVREAFAGRLVIRKGLEFDFQSRHAGRLAERLSGWRFDFLLGSVHNVFNHTPPSALRMGWPADEVYRVYFDEVEALVATGLPTCLGHLDYVRKTAWRELDAYRYPGYESRMKEIAAGLVAAGIGLEVNSRYMDRGQPVAPGVEALAAYRAAGGRIVTLGSDAHAAAEVGRGLSVAARVLREAGFTHYMAFSGGQPTARPLPQGNLLTDSDPASPVS